MDYIYGFLKGKLVVLGVKFYIVDKVFGENIVLLINMDFEDFFLIIIFERVRGMFKVFGYSGYILFLFVMLCIYCEWMLIEVKGKVKYVKILDRILF